MSMEFDAWCICGTAIDHRISAFSDGILELVRISKGFAENISNIPSHAFEIFRVLVDARKSEL